MTNEELAQKAITVAIAAFRNEWQKTWPEGWFRQTDSPNVELIVFAAQHLEQLATALLIACGAIRELKAQNWSFRKEAASRTRENETPLTLSQVIQILRQYPKDAKVDRGFAQPDSWRGDYSHLAFAPLNDTTAGQMLDHAESALGATYEGWKGGKYRMDEDTPCHLAELGEVNWNDHILSEGYLQAMLQNLDYLDILVKNVLPSVAENERPKT